MAQIPERGIPEKKVCLVMVTYNRFEVLLQSINTILDQVRQVEYFVVVDNGSTDGTVTKLKAQFEKIHVVELKGNMGYAAGLAAGMQYAQSCFPDINYFWLMDDDSHPQRDCLKKMVEIKLDYPFDGILSVTGFVDTIWQGPVRFSNYSNKTSKLRKSTFPLYDVDHALIDGALIDAKVVAQIGFPDSKFFMMCEDVEYCKRMKKHGFEIILWDNEIMMNRLHQGGGGGFTKSNLWRGYYGSRNHLLILRDYFSLKGALSYFLRQTKFVFYAFLAKDRFQRIYYRLLGIYHGFRGISGKSIEPF